MGVLIDPYMFELSDAQEIENNISFFEKMIKLCTLPDGMQRMRVLLYKGVFEKINQRSIQPFPINLHAITDPDLRKTIMQINKSFNHVWLQSIDIIDIDECSGEQEFEITADDAMSDDENYYEMFCTLLIPCYLKRIDINDKILTGKKKCGRQIGDQFQIECRCSEKKYIKKCLFAGIDDFISAKEKALKSLKEKKKNGGILIAGTVLAEMGDHHNHVQANGKKFSTLNELSFKNKAVLKLLQELGLFKIIFGRFTSQGVRASGTMSILCVEEKETQDIVRVKFNAETQMQFLADLYFSKGVGQQLYNYFQTEQLTYLNVRELVDRLR